MQVLSIKNRSLMERTLSTCNRKQCHPGQLMKVGVGEGFIQDCHTRLEDFRRPMPLSLVICRNCMSTWSQHATSVSINRGKTVCSWLNLLINKLTKKLPNKNSKYQCIRTKLSEVLILPSCIFCTSGKKKVLQTLKKQGILTRLMGILSNRT